MNKAISILCFVFGVSLFAAAAINGTRSVPVLRATEDSAINAAYDAPLTNAKIGDDISESRKVRTHQRISAVVNSTIAKPVRADAAETNAEASLGFGTFSTQAARDYQTVRYKSRVPNIRYEASQCGK